MAKFNSTATIRTTNKCGHAAYAMSDKSKLITQVLTSFFNEAKFYGDNSREMQETIKRVIATDAAFVSNLAVYARRVFNMRTVAHVLTAYLAHEVAGKPYARKTIKGICLRGDDVTELLSFYLATFDRPIPNSLRKGINDVFITFDEYTLAKYKGEDKTLKMRDVILLCHPVPLTDEQSAMWKRCIEGKLKTPITWETQLSTNGNNAETWEKLINSGKVGYMALLRNLRNIIKANPSNIEKVYQTIESPERVKISKQLPFRFLSAYKSISGIAGSRAFDALEAAAEASIDNMIRLPGTTVIAVDVSGSMSNTVSAKSEARCIEIGAMLGMLANRICDNAIFYVFNGRLYRYDVSRRDPIIKSALAFHATGGTDMSLPFDAMINGKIQADRVIIISDNECNSGRRTPVQSRADAYRMATGNDIWVHAIDLQGYGTQQFYGKKTNIIAGWSEKTLDFISLAEQGEGSLMQAIENYSY